MTFGLYTVDYEQRAYNPERMRKERLERAHTALNRFGFGSMVAFSYDTHRYLGFYSLHQYARRRPGTFLLLIKDAGYPYAPADRFSPTGEEELMPWYKDRMKLTTSNQGTVFQGYPDNPEFMVGEWDKVAAEIKGLLEEHGVANLPCGVDMTNLHMTDACRRAGINMVDGNHVMAAARMVKTRDEIECLRTAGAITESAHWEVCKALRPGVTEWQMAGVVAKALFDLGAEDMEGPSFVVCSGERSGHNVPAMPTDRMIRPGDMFIIDINGISFQGYRTCFYRTYVVGDKPTEFQKEVYQCAYEGQMALTNAIKPGLTNLEIQQNWMNQGKKPGGWGSQPKWPEPGRYYRGTVAHHIGLCSGDPGPAIPGTIGAIDRPTITIEKNMCFAVETGCYVWDGKNWARDGVKLEHCGVVTDDGFEVFYRFPIKDLIACGLPGKY
ncbi:M24 family metallopeptidase [Chloroflexota bacterium]